MVEEVFQIGSPVHGNLFAGRKKLTDEIANGLRSTKVVQHFALVGFRRIGKSSIMQVVGDKLKKDENTIVVYIDLQQVIPFSIGEFLKLYSANVLEAYYLKKGDKALALKAKNFVKNGVGELKEIISGFRGEIKDFLVFWFEKTEKNSLSSYVKEALNLPETLATGNEKFVIMLDEFQEINRLGLDLEKAFRANVQQMKKTSLLVSGSQVSIMKRLVHSKTSPLYNFFITKHVEELEPNEATTFLTERFKAAGAKVTSEAIEEIVKLTNAHPYHLQWLGRASLFKATKNIITKETVEEAFAWAIREEAGHLEYEYSKLKGKYRAIIVACVKLGSAEPIEIARQLREQSDSIRPFLPNLVDEGYLVKQDSKYKVRDPVFEAYIARKMQFSS